MAEKRNRMIKTAALFSSLLALRMSAMPVQAEEVTYAWDEDTRVTTLRRKIATSIDIYTDGESEDITHEEGMINGVLYDILRVTPTEHTRLQVDYSEQPLYLDELADEKTLDEGFLYAGGINAGYFSNSGDNYGQPVGAVRRNHAWTDWYGTENAPAYGNGFATAYISGDDLSLKYHGWAWGQWNGDQSWHWSTGYTMNEAYGVSGSYTYFSDGIQRDITNGDAGVIDYRTYGRALTILAQKEDKQYLLITIFGTLEEDDVIDFLLRLDVYDAIRMDGGGSTQMVYETSLVKETEPELLDTKIAEEEMNDNSDPIGYAFVNVDKLRVRSGARTESPAKGYATRGERYQVYEIKIDSQYKWYRIGDHRWIAGSEDWVSYESLKQAEMEEHSEETVSVTVRVDNLNIRKEPSISAEIVGKAENGKTYTAKERKKAYGYDWYCIGEDQWIAGNEEWVTVKK